MKLRYCGGCGTKAELPPGEPMPAGWYAVSVSTAYDTGPNQDKRYRWLGIFCTIACLVSMAPVWHAEAERRHALVASRAVTS